MRMADILSFHQPISTKPPYCSLSRCSSSSSSSSSSKHSDRLLSTLSKSASADPSAADRIIRKFLRSSSKSTALHTLSLLLSRSSPFTFPIYQRITATDWFKWSPKLAAQLISLLESTARSAEADVLLSDSISRLSSSRDLGLFYCHLVDAASDRNMKPLVLDSYERMKRIPFSGRKAFESMIRAFSSIGMPADAEKMLEEMSESGFEPSGFEYRLVIQGYGRSGSFADMTRIFGMMEEEKVDTVCANVILSCYGDHGRLSEMVSWLVKMRESGIDFSIRTFNTVLNSCPNLVSMVMARELEETIPLSMEEFFESLQGDESLLVQELVSSSVLGGILKWSDLEGELDLHGLHLVPAYVVLLQWMEEMRCRLSHDFVPMEVSIVCGSGKHSNVRGDSPLRKLVSKMMVRLQSPMKIDRRNVGRYVAKGKVVKEWLCSS